MSSEVHLENVSKSLDGNLIVNNVSVTAKKGEFLTLLGPSGCGKTTTLRIVAGFITPDLGHVQIGSRDVSAVPVHRRNVGMVFQNYALFPHLTVSENIEYGLLTRKISRAEIALRVNEILELVQLTHLRDRNIRQLSGGQQQRVALARAVVIRPDVLLLDEPLSALDLKLRHELQVQMKRVQVSLGMTALYVTHDQGEALSLSDRIAVMKDGCIQQLDDPISIYERPKNVFVANFLGRTNLLEVEYLGIDTARSAHQVRSRDGARRYSVATTPDAPARHAPGERCLLGFRPERAVIGSENANRLTVTIKKQTYYGSLWSLDLEGDSGEAIQLEVRNGSGVTANDTSLDLSWKPEDCFLLPHAA